MKKITLILITLLMLTCMSSAASLKKTIGGVSVTTTIPEGRTVIMNYTKDLTKFSRWVVDTNNLTLADPTSTTISFKMPAVNVEIRAEEVPDEHSLTVSVDGELIEEMQRSAGESITLTAVEGNGKVFSSWQITGLTGANATSNPLTFTMPNNDVEIIATFKDIGPIIANAAVPIGAYIEYVPTSTSAKVYEADSGYGTDDANTEEYQEFNPSVTTSWRVMYNNSGQLDIVSTDAVNATNGDGLYLKGKRGYAKVVDTLNNLCSAYVNTAYATSGRSIGCTSESVGTIDESTISYRVATYDIPYTDELYSTDENQLTGNSLLSNSTTWLASRYGLSALGNSYQAIFYVRYSSGPSPYYEFLHVESSENGSFEQATAYAIRPVVSLSPDIRIIGGSGTSADPYQIVR